MRDILLVDESDIEQAIVMLLEIEKTLAEGAGGTCDRCRARVAAPVHVGESRGSSWRSEVHPCRAGAIGTHESTIRSAQVRSLIASN
ncbi:MAG: hypothetical protein EHM55_17805 [Acidobacteria bacterium]|nr:MAG: hypothetical protein EHM55_17805 [Acidobacteriota bacterium]